MSKTQEIVDNGDGTMSLHTVDDQNVVVTTVDVVKLDDDKAREILYVENDIRVLQARLADLQAAKVETAKLAATAGSLRPLPVGKDGGGGGALKVG
jgi:hypothetical protein